jgi:apolipoprotein N-acyltransferase
MLRYRAIESRRWLVRARGPHAFVCDPYGRLTLDLRGIEGAGIEEVWFAARDTGYVRLGALWEGALVLAVAGAVLVRAARRWWRRPPGRRGQGPLQ